MENYEEIKIVPKCGKATTEKLGCLKMKVMLMSSNQHRRT